MGVYRRHNRLWCNLRDESGQWVKKPTPDAVGEEKKAEKYAAERQRIIDERRAAGTEGPLTVKRYSEAWTKERRERGVRSADVEAATLKKHALPHLGGLTLTEVRPRHVRDMVRALRKAGTLAPRTIRNVYGAVHTMFEDALCDEKIEANPCKLKSGELPGKVDADPEWRAAATYTAPEVEQQI